MHVRRILSRVSPFWNLVLILLMAGLALPAKSQTFTVLHAFKGGPTDGGTPHSGVIDVGGNLYGTTTVGGANIIGGTVYKLSSSGAQTIIYNFQGGSDGENPYAGLVRDKSNNGYGTTESGGATAGVVFKINSHGNETVFYTFKGAADGWFPTTSLIVDPAGNLYGTLPSGGDFAIGSVDKFDSGGNVTPLHQFAGGTDGSTPQAPLVRDSAGNLYGTTQYGGYSIGYGTVFKIDASGNETVLYRFTGGADGSNPVAGLVLDGRGNLYGTTQFGGNFTACPNVGCGVVFRLSPSGKETVLYSFAGGNNDGAGPIAGLTLGKAKLYGTTARGGASGRGTIFEIDGIGKEKVLHFFNGTDGAYPDCTLAIDGAGHLYGTAPEEGANFYGTVFELVL